MTKAKIIRVATIILLIAGLLVLFYPALNNIIFVVKQNRVIDDYNAQVSEMDQTAIDDMKKEAQQYNEMLSNPTTESDGEEGVSGNLSYSQLLNVANQQMGYIVIPKISLNQPIYHSTDEAVLEHGIGHLENTSLPVGGANTHCVLTGHTGVPGMMLFTDLEKMETGDKFYIKVLDEVLAYEVDQIKVVLPEDTDDLKIVDGEDYVTLITCTPYGINTHRLLVRGTRVEYNGEIDVETVVTDNNAGNIDEAASEDSAGSTSVVSTQQSKFSIQFIVYYILIPAIIAVAIIVAVIIVARKKKKLNASK